MPCRHTNNNIGRMMSCAIGFAFLRRQSMRIYEIHFSIMAAVWPSHHIIFFRIQTMLGLHFHFVCARFSNRVDVVVCDRLFPNGKKNYTN